MSDSLSVQALDFDPNSASPGLFDGSPEIELEPQRLIFQLVVLLAGKRNGSLLLPVGSRLPNVEHLIRLWEDSFVRCRAPLPAVPHLCGTCEQVGFLVSGACTKCGPANVVLASDIDLSSNSSSNPGSSDSSKEPILNILQPSVRTESIG